MEILLLGVGMQGKAALHDLVNSKEVIRVKAADQDVAALKAHVEDRHYGSKVQCEYLDASNPEQIEALFSENPDVIIDLLPIPFIDSVASAAVKHGIHLVNTLYTTPKIKELANEARANNIIILPEFGLDPGIDLVLLGEAVRNLDRIEEIMSYGAGIPEPEAANNPIKYKVTWTFDGVLQAYSRDSHILFDGKSVKIKAAEMFSPENIHHIEIEGLGKLEAYPNGDALKYTNMLDIDRSELQNTGRFSLRWPGHCAFWKKIVDLHLLDDEPVYVDGKAVDRKRFLAAVIEPHIQLGAKERDIALVRIEVKGERAGENVRAVYQMIDRRDLKTGLTGMSRTVGYTASIGAQMIGKGKITGCGVLSPIKDIPYELLVQELRKRGIRITSELTTLE